MIDHAQYRSAVLADPKDASPELRAHVDSCAECRAFTEKLQRFESKLARALAIEAGPGTPFSADVVPLASRRRSGAPRWLALAASALFGAVLVGTIWVAVPSRSLAAAVVAHMAGELDAWKTEAPVPEPELDAVLLNAKIKLMPQAGTVSYASGCLFRGYVVPHLVVQTDAGPVTVMVLVHETKAKWRQFDEQGYRGVIVPVPGHGSLAILMQDPHSDTATVQRIAAKVRESIVWTR
jgi:Protein of unknown function (DUF3379)